MLLFLLSHDFTITSSGVEVCKLNPLRCLVLYLKTFTTPEQHIAQQVKNIQAQSHNNHSLTSQSLSIPQCPSLSVPTCGNTKSN